MTIVDLRSDFLTRPTSAMLAAMVSAARRPAHFGLREDPDQIALEGRIAAMLGAEDALFFPTCTMANQVALMLLTAPGDCVLAQPDVHVLTSEAGAPAMLAGVQIISVQGRSPCPAVTAWEELAAVPSDELKPRMAAIILENTHTRTGGTVLPVPYMRNVLSVARRSGLHAHLDGSRLFNAAVALGVPPSDLCLGFDTVAVSLNKGLGAPVGAALAMPAPLMARALVLRQRLGGGMRPLGVLASAALEALDLDHLVADHRRARDLALGISTIPGLDVDLAQVQTNIVLVTIEAPNLSAVELCRRLSHAGVRALPFGPRRIRLVTYRDIDDDDIDVAITTLSTVLAEPPSTK